MALTIVISARRPLVRIAWAACLLIGLAGGLSPALAAKRIELYNAEGQPTAMRSCSIVRGAWTITTSANAGADGGA